MKLEACVPPAWARTGHAQTILGHLLPSPLLKSKGKEVRIPLPDGDVLVAFIQEGASDTVVYIFHGLAGSTDSPYMHRTAMLALREGHTVVMVNHRGCGEGAGLSAKPYHSGRGEDLSAAVAYGRRLFPNKRHVAVGFSLSGNALLLLMSGRRGDVQPDAAIAVNAPIHLERTAHLLKEGLNRIYDIKFYTQCRRDILRGRADEALKKNVPLLTTLHALDSLYTAPAGGFRDREDFYTSCSTYQALKEIKRPTIILTTQDDPFVPYDSYREAQLSKEVWMHIEEFGGHMGYLSKENTPLGTKRWQDYALSVALKEI